MSGSVNKVILVGNLGADPDVRRTQDGKPVVNLRIATGHSWRDKQTGERKQHTDWHRVVIFSEGLAKIAEQYLKKGSKVYVEGELKTRKWVDQGGVDRYSTDVVLNGFNAVLTLLDKREGAGPSEGDYGTGDTRDFSRPSTNAGAGQAGGTRSDMDDEIPF